MMYKHSLFIVALLLPCMVFAASEGPSSPGTGATGGGGNCGAVWTSTSNIVSSNNAYATSCSIDVGETSDFIHATNFSFSIPTDATIDGVVVTIEGKATRNSAVSTNDTLLIIGGSRTGSKPTTFDSSDWGLSDSTKTYGASNELWGATPTAAQVNASDFGVAIQATASQADEDLLIDHVTMTVHYTEAVPDLHEWAMIFLVLGGVYFLYREGVLDGIIHQY